VCIPSVDPWLPTEATRIRHQNYAAMIENIDAHISGLCPGLSFAWKRCVFTPSRVRRPLWAVLWLHHQFEAGNVRTRRSKPRLTPRPSSLFNWWQPFILLKSNKIYHLFYHIHLFKLSTISPLKLSLSFKY
jgi:hypothetical protein